MNKYKGIKAEIIIDNGEETKTFEMHSFSKAFLRQLCYIFNSNFSPPLTLEARSQASRTDTGPTFSRYISMRLASNPYVWGTDAIASSTAEEAVFDHQLNAFVSFSAVTNGDGTRSLVLSKMFKNKSASAQTVLTTLLTSVAVSPTNNNVIASDTVNVTVGINNLLSISYSFLLSKNFTQTFLLILLDCLSPKYREQTPDYPVVKSILNVSNNAVFTSSNFYSSLISSASRVCGIVVGSSSSAITGNEYALRSEIALADLSYSGHSGAITAPTAEITGGTLTISRLVQNISTNPVTINEVAYYANYPTAFKTMLFIDVLTTPITLAPQESAIIELAFKVQ